jgi:uncharacterized protein (DUF3820 family)
MPETPFDRDILRKTVIWKMPFGKFEGRLIADLPAFYLEWFKTKGFPDGKLGAVMETVYEIKLNGLEEILVKLKKMQGM